MSGALLRLNRKPDRPLRLPSAAKAGIIPQFLRQVSPLAKESTFWKGHSFRSFPNWCWRSTFGAEPELSAMDVRVA